MKPPPPIRDPRLLGLCATCVHVRPVVSAKGSVFWLCREPTLPKYPPLPVRRCPGFAPEAE
ncbi:MAG: hypothetical protein KF901_28980 [Myxococcales bacterium]|nr:hypothetical protein [Myxococcales bacterium]